jgi:hypothetical protein
MAYMLTSDPRRLRATVQQTSAKNKMASESETRTPVDKYSHFFLSEIVVVPDEVSTARLPPGS